jgi:hypothetical protein
MRRKKNIYLGWGAASKKERQEALTVYRRPKQRPVSHGKTRVGSDALGGIWSSVRADVAAALVNQGYDRATAKKAAASAKGSDFDSLFRSAIKRNPREFPAVTDSQLQALRKRVSVMPKKRRTKKKSSRKGKMPAGLKAYWAKKRRAKAKRRNPKRKRATVRRRKPAARRRQRVSVRVRSYRKPRRRAARRASRRRSNPIHTAKRITLKGFTASQIRTVASVVRRATGKRVRVVKP